LSSSEIGSASLRGHVRQLRFFGDVVFLAVVYYLSARSGLAAGSLPGNVAPVWPSAGFALAVLLRRGRGLWPGVALGALAVNGFGGSVPLVSAVGMAAGNTLVAVGAASVLGRMGFRPALDRTRDVAAVVVAAALGSAAGATVGTLSLRLGGLLPAAGYWAAWRTWWLGDGVGVLVVTPALLAGFGLPGRGPVRPRLELAGFVLVVAVTSLRVVGPVGYPYLALPLVAWGAVRFGLPGATLATLVTAVAMATRAGLGHGPFAASTTELLRLDAFLAMMAFSGLVVATVVAERNGAAARLEAANRGLEDRVRQRTAALDADRERLAEAQRIAGIGSWDLDLHSETVIWSDELYRIFGVDPATFEPTFHALLWLVDPADRAMVSAGVEAALARRQPFLFDYRVPQADGRVRWVRARGQLIADEAGEVVGMRGTCQDITDRKQAEEQFRELLEAAPDAMVITGEDGTIVLVNRAAERLFLRRRDELVGQPVEVLVPERFRHPHRLHRADYAAAAEGRAMGRGRELMALRGDGTEFPVEVNLSPLRTEHGTLVSAGIRDLTERKEAEAALTHHALHDPLTGLPNRSLLLDRIEVALARSARVGKAVAVLFLDLDRFKLINDSRGHRAGDVVLRAVAERLRAAVRPSDTVGRLGGDEFVVVCEDAVAVWEATVLGERLLRTLEEPFDVEGGEVFVTVSVGIAIAEQTVSAEELLRDADVAMYQAKQRGRARCEFFDEPMRTEAARRLETATALHRALDRDEFETWYQPMVDLASGAIVGVEALVRWNDPERGLVPPAAFIPLAEEQGLIVPVGARVLDAACRQWARWRAEFPARDPLILNVNISARQLHRPEFLESIRSVLLRHGVDPGALCLELTESVLIDDVEAQRHTLAALRELGVGLAIDDFGTGYSSLTYLKRLPVNGIKIDQTFVAGLGRETFDSAIIESVIALAHAVGLRVTAEGVHTIEQLRRLRALGCDFAQGYYFARPQRAADLDALLDCEGQGTLARAWMDKAVTATT
jgi:diguanylate cyclase (GGDEF)-like protein/PAS domain S-box-containing protein